MGMITLTTSHLRKCRSSTLAIRLIPDVTQTSQTCRNRNRRVFAKRATTSPKFRSCYHHVDSWNSLCSLGALPWFGILLPLRDYLQSAGAAVNMEFSVQGVRFSVRLDAWGKMRYVATSGYARVCRNGLNIVNYNSLTFRLLRPHPGAVALYTKASLRRYDSANLTNCNDS